MNKTRKKINQQACYNRIWSWSPVPCKKHGPRASVTTKTSAFSLGFCLLSPSGHFFTRHGRPWSNPTFYQPMLGITNHAFLPWQTTMLWCNFLGTGSCVWHQNIIWCYVISLYQIPQLVLLSWIAHYVWVWKCCKCVSISYNSQYLTSLKNSSQQMYHQTSNIRHTKSQNQYICHLVLQLSLHNPLQSLR